MDGSINAYSLSDFWEIRAAFIAEEHKINKEDYYTKSVTEFEKIINLPNYAEVCLWFENDLFCQVNMWFVISLLTKNRTLKIYRIFPVVQNQADYWKGFGVATNQMLLEAYEKKVLFNETELAIGLQLWEAYKLKNFDALLILGQAPHTCFKQLHQIAIAHIERQTYNDELSRPEQTIKALIAVHGNNFENVFENFCKKEGIYGFSDLQVKAMYNKLL